jgi:Atypical Arm repeat
MQAKREALYALCNSTKGAPQAHMQFLVEYGFLDLLEISIQEHISDSKFLVVVIHALSELLQTGHDPRPGMPNAFQAHLEISGLVDEIEKLQRHQNRPVYTAIIDLIEKYFEVEDPI